MDHTAWDDASWWIGAYEEDTTKTFELESEDGTWANGFLPPPPRPFFLDQDIQTDGLTTCDLCSWASAALKPTNQTLDDTIETIPWSVTLIVVSMFSALVGAILMMTLRHCIKRMNTTEARYRETDVRNSDRREVMKDVDRERDNGSGGVWCWVRRRPTLDSPSDTPATNHYTVDEAYSGVEALYAELDKPVYQNTGYVLDPDTSSPPSSAYYSDLSERTYETVGQSWEMSQHPVNRHRLTAIAESAPVHSDYV